MEGNRRTDSEHILNFDLSKTRAKCTARRENEERIYPVPGRISGQVPILKQNQAEKQRDYGLHYAVQTNEANVQDELHGGKRRVHHERRSETEKYQPRQNEIKNMGREGKQH